MKKSILMAMMLAASCSSAQADTATPAADTPTTKPDTSATQINPTNQNATPPQASTSDQSSNPSQPSPAQDTTAPQAMTPDQNQQPQANTPANNSNNPSASSSDQDTTAPQPTPAAQDSSAPQTPPQSPGTTAPGQETGTQASPVSAMPTTFDCLQKIQPDEKEVNPVLIEKWAEQAALQTFTMQAGMVDQQLTDLEKCFTTSGWQGYKSALDKSGNLAAIKKEQLNVSSSVIGKPILENSKENQWNVTVPLAVVYKNSKDSINQNLNVKLLISRNKDGSLGIMQVVAAPKKEQSNQDSNENTTQNPATPSNPS